MTEQPKEYETVDGHLMREVSPHQYVNKRWLVRNGYLAKEFTPNALTIAALKEAEQQAREAAGNSEEEH